MNKLIIRTKQSLKKQTRKSSGYPEPSVVIKPGCSEQAAAFLKGKNKEKILVVTDKNIIKLGITDEFVACLRNEGLDYIVFNGIIDNPTVDNILDGAQVYINNHCDSIIGFGGRAAIDAAKLIGARTSNKMDIYDMKGSNKLRRKLPTLVAVPTIAGTGSEADFKAVVTDTNRFEKITVIDKKLLPEISYLDSILMNELPSEILARSGMNLLAKAMESYLSRYCTRTAEKFCIETMKLVIENLEPFYDNSLNIEAGTNLFTASYYSGRANMLALTGYGDHIGYFLSDTYGISHSYVLSVIIPHLLESSRDKISKKLSKLAVELNLGKKDEESAILVERVISRIREMNAYMDIPEYIEELKERDIKVLAGIIEKNSNPSVPAPKILKADDFEKLLYSVLNVKNENEGIHLEEDFVYLGEEENISEVAGHEYDLD